MKWELLYKKNKSKDTNNHSVEENVINQLFINRGIADQSVRDKFFNISRNDIYHGSKLYGTKKASEFLLKAIQDKKKIIIYGDYDVDGVTATSILFDFLYRDLGADVIPFIPNRFDDGYGLNVDVLDDFVSKKIDIVITVDCGIRDKDLVETYSKKGINFIITDHHSPATDQHDKYILPDKAVAIVHPNLGKYPFPKIAGATVSWKLVEVLSKLALEVGFLKEKINIDKYLDQVALATVCDIMPLQDENRAIVHFGLKQFAKSKNIGLLALTKYLNIDLDEIESYHLGFTIGPRINASGRIKHALTSVRLLTTQDAKNAEKIVLELDRLNTYRRKITIELVEEVELKLKRLKKIPKLIFAYGNDWPEGIVGLIAGKLTEKYSRPVLIGSLKDNVVKGSARSVKDFNITEAISKFDSLLDRYGGHKLAAGFSLSDQNIEEFKTQLQKLAEQELSDDDLIPTVKVEANLPIELLNFDFINKLTKLKPFGYGNKRPIFLLENYKILQLRVIGKEKTHLKLQVSKVEKKIDVIGFNQADKIAQLSTGTHIDMVGYLDINIWNGNKTIQFNLKDLKINEKNS